MMRIMQGWAHVITQRSDIVYRRLCWSEEDISLLTQQITPHLPCPFACSDTLNQRAIVVGWMSPRPGIGLGRADRQDRAS